MQHAKVVKKNSLSGCKLNIHLPAFIINQLRGERAGGGGRKLKERRKGSKAGWKEGRMEGGRG